MSTRPGASIHVEPSVAGDEHGSGVARAFLHSETLVVVPQRTAARHLLDRVVDVESAWRVGTAAQCDVVAVVTAVRREIFEG